MTDKRLKGTGQKRAFDSVATNKKPAQRTPPLLTEFHLDFGKHASRQRVLRGVPEILNLVSDYVISLWIICYETNAGLARCVQ